MLKTHKYRSLSLLLTLGVVVGQLFPVLADDEVPTEEIIPESNFDSSGDFGTEDNNGFTEDFGDENPGNDSNGSGTGTTEQPVETPPAPDTTPEPPAASNPGTTNPTEPVEPVPAPEPAPGPQEVELTGNAEKGKITVEGSTTPDILPEGTYIQVGLLEDDQKTAILQGLKDSKYSIDGILPIDISFLVNGVDADDNPVTQSITPELPVDLKLSINKDLIQSDKDIDWNSVELVKVTTNDTGKYQKETLIKNKDLELVDLPTETEPVDADQNPEPTEDTASGTVQESAPVLTTESGSASEPTEPSASNNPSTETTTLETTAFDQVEDTEEKKAGDVDADKSSAETSKTYQGTVALDGSTQIALTWKNKKSSIIGSVIQDAFEIVDNIADFIQGIDKEMNDIKLPSALDNEASNSLKKDESTFIDLSNNPSLELPKTLGTSNSDVTFSGQAGSVVVNASTTSDILPADAAMKVSMIDANRTEYETAVDALEEHSVEYDGVKVVDISFWKDGQEIEPENGSVNIQMSFDKDLLDEDVESGTVEVHHIVEESETVTVQSVATEADKTVAENQEQNAYDAEFNVNHFSQFTITWQTGKNNKRRAEITVTLRDLNGNELDINNRKDITIRESPANISLESEGRKREPENYQFVKAMYGGKTVDKIRFVKDDDNCTITFYYQNNPVSNVTYDKDTIKKLSLDFIYEQLSVENFQWKVVFDANGASGEPPAAITGTESDVARITIPDSYMLQNPDYNFIGWATSKPAHDTQDGYLVYKPGETYTPSVGKTTLYAVWSKKDYSDTAGFYIYVATNTELPDEPSQHSTGDYTGKIEIPNAISVNSWIIDKTMDPVNRYVDSSGNLSDTGIHANNEVSRNLRALPNIDQIYKALEDKRKLPEVPEDVKSQGEEKVKEYIANNYYVLWYVQKRSSGTWHIDGALCKKNLVNVNYIANTGGLYTGPLPLSYQTEKGTEIKVGTETKDKTSKIVDPTWEGHTFLGWTLTQDPGDNPVYYRGGDLYTVSENTTFYAQWAINTVTLTIEKNVKGNLAELNKKFDFTVKVWKNESDSTPIEHHFTLQNNEQKTIEVSKYSFKCQIVENEASDYETTYKIDDDSVSEGKSAEIISIQANTKVTFTNTKETHNPITGIGDHNSLAWIVGLAGGAAMIALLIWMKKQRYEKE